MTKLGDQGVRGIYRSDARNVLEKYANNESLALQELKQNYVVMNSARGNASAGYGKKSETMSDAMTEVMAFVPPRVRLQRAEEYLPPKIVPHRITRAEMSAPSLSAAARAAHRVPPGELRQIQHVLDRLAKTLTSNAQMRELEEIEARADLLPNSLSRAQACAIMRTIENPLRRKDAIVTLAPRLDSTAQDFADELQHTSWPADIKVLCGDKDE